MSVSFSAHHMPMLGTEWRGDDGPRRKKQNFRPQSYLWWRPELQVLDPWAVIHSQAEPASSTPGLSSTFCMLRFQLNPGHLKPFQGPFVSGAPMPLTRAWGPMGTEW